MRGHHEEQGHRDESVAWAWYQAMHRHGHLRAVCARQRTQRCRVKRGNLYPEQHQIGMRLASCQQGGSPEHAGRWLEHVSNGVPRGMITGQRLLAYRIRPAGLPCLFLSVVHRSGRAPRQAYTLVVVHPSARSVCLLLALQGLHRAGVECVTDAERDQRTSLRRTPVPARLPLL